MAARFSRARRFSASVLLPRVLDGLQAPGRVEHDAGEDLREGQHELARLVQLHPGHAYHVIAHFLVRLAGPLQQLVEAGDIEVAEVLHQDQAVLLALRQLVQGQEVLPPDDPAPREGAGRT